MAIGLNIGASLKTDNVRESQEVRAWQLVDYRMTKHELGMALWPVLPDDHPEDDMRDKAYKTVDYVEHYSASGGREPFRGEAIEWQTMKQLRTILGDFEHESDQMIQY